MADSATHVPSSAQAPDAHSASSRHARHALPSQTGADGSQSAALWHAVDTQVCPTHASPAAHSRFSSVTPKREQSAGSLQQKEGFASVEQLARSASEIVMASRASAPARGAARREGER